MSEPTPTELLAQLAAMQAQMAKLQQQLTAQQSGAGTIGQDDSTVAGKRGAAIGGNVDGVLTFA